MLFLDFVRPITPLAGPKYYSKTFCLITRSRLVTSLWVIKFFVKLLVMLTSNNRFCWYCKIRSLYRLILWAFALIRCFSSSVTTATPLVSILHFPHNWFLILGLLHSVLQTCSSRLRAFRNWSTCPYNRLFLPWFFCCFLLTRFGTQPFGHYYSSGIH